MNQTNTVFICALVIISFGYFLKYKKIISEKDGKVISKLLMHTTFPALIVVTMMRVHFEVNLLLLPAIAFCFSIFSMLTASWFLKRQDSKIRTVLIMGSGGYNLGLFAYPLIEGIWGPPGMVYAAMFDLGNSLAVFGLVYGTGVFFSDKKEGVTVKENIKKAFFKIIGLVPFQALLIGIVINLTNFKLPNIMVEILDILAKGNKVIALLIMGIYLNISLTPKILQQVSKVLLIRYFWGLALGFLCFYFLPFEPLYRNVLLIVLIIPVGMTLLPFSDELGYDTKIAGMLVNISMLISFAMMWALVLGMKLA
jgi:predicted permease